MSMYFLPPCEQRIKLEELEENTLYEVDVAWCPSNPVHKAFLFVGFHNGNYCEIYTNSYENPIKAKEAYWVEIVKKLSSLKNSDSKEKE